MKTASSGMKTHLTLECTSLARCWRIERKDGMKFYFTSFDQNLTIDGNVYLATEGFTNTATSNKSDLSVDSLDILGVFDNAAITISDLRAGLFDFATVYFFLVNWADLTQGSVALRRGTLGECRSSPQGFFTVELRGMTQVLQQQIIELYGPNCRADLGDARCTIPLNPPLRANSTAYTVGQFIKVATASGVGEQVYENLIYECTTAGTSAASEPTWNDTVGGTTTDGTAVFTGVTAWTRNGVIASITDQTNFAITITEPRAVDKWFNHGLLTFNSGLNNGKTLEVKGWVQSGALVELYIGAGYPLTVGDVFAITPGCDKTLATCRDKFNNILNMRAEPYLPGNDTVFNYPDSGQ